MARYFEFSGNSIDFPIRADFTERREYFEDFVLGGGRDLRAYGLTRITPNLTVEYDVNGLRFLRYVLGSETGTSPYTITVGSTLPVADYKVTVEGDNMSIHSAKVDTWEITIEEGNPVRAEFTVIGRNIGSQAALPFSPDFNNMPILPHQCTLNINGVINTLWTRISLRINNALEPIFKTSSIPVEIRETGLEITGRIRAPEYTNWAPEGSIDLIVGRAGTITVRNVKFTEVPPRVTGFDLPETEISFSGYPVGTLAAIFARVGSKW